jgi:hypothetical protein
MSDEIAKLKAELEALNLQCQLARDHEIRYALQRTRLETARMQLMLKIVDAVASPPEVAPAPPVIIRVPPPSSPALADAERQPVQVQKRRSSIKPAGLPTLTDMVLAVLDGERTPGAGMRPRDIARIACQVWGPGIRAHGIATAAWKLAGRGQLEKNGSLYKLNGHAGE